MISQLLHQPLFEISLYVFCKAIIVLRPHLQTPLNVIQSVGHWPLTFIVLFAISVSESCHPSLFHILQINMYGWYRRPSQPYCPDGESRKNIWSTRDSLSSLLIFAIRLDSTCAVVMVYAAIWSSFAELLSHSLSHNMLLDFFCLLSIRLSLSTQANVSFDNWEKGEADAALSTGLPRYVSFTTQRLLRDTSKIL